MHSEYRKTYGGGQVLNEHLKNSAVEIYLQKNLDMAENFCCWYSRKCSTESTLYEIADLNWS